MEEVEKDGIGGLFSGFGKGVVGYVENFEVCVLIHTLPLISHHEIRQY